MLAKKKVEAVPINKLETVENNYLEKIDTDPRFSIEIDPENRYNFSETQKDFISNYIQFKNVPLAAKLSGIDEDTAVMYYKSYSVKAEIRRINIALYHRAFATRMLTIDEIGGYLTSVLIGENLAEADKIGTRDKMQVIKLMLELTKMKQESFANPDKVIDAVDIQEDLSNLSVDAIQQLINSSKKPKETNEDKNDIVEEINKVNNWLSTEELQHLKTLSTSELLNILEESNKNLNKDNNSSKKEEDKSSDLHDKFKKLLEEDSDETI